MQVIGYRGYVILIVALMPQHLAISCPSELSIADCKGNGIAIQAWTGPEGSRRLKLPDFKTIGI
jgi:hypothetical protein